MSLFDVPESTTEKLDLFLDYSDYLFRLFTPEERAYWQRQGLFIGLTGEDYFLFSLMYSNS